jgi:hypothetical protein
VKKEIEKAAEKAKSDPEIALDEMYNNIYINPDSAFTVRGCDSGIRATSR